MDPAALHAYTLARTALANTWRTRHIPLTGWAARHMTRDYPFWRGVNLARVMRCREAVRGSEYRGGLAAYSMANAPSDYRSVVG